MNESKETVCFRVLDLEMKESETIPGAVECVGSRLVSEHPDVEAAREVADILRAENREIRVFKATLTIQTELVY